MSSKQPRKPRKAAANRRGEPGSSAAASPPEKPTKRQERVYTDAQRLEAMYVLAEEGSPRLAALKLGYPEGTIEDWARHPRWGTELLRIRQQNLEGMAELRDALRAGYLGTAREARELLATLIDQERRVAAGESIPAASRVRPGAVLGAVRESISAFTELDKSAKLQVEGGGEGKVSVQVLRGSGVRREPSAVES